MEKKTIGGFIAALRKANGMTQKDLAERLNVSDKTVSRWERDDGAPDLSAIPVIAEIFNVTCDELLRGERKSPAERTETPEENERTPKGEKQRQRLLKLALSQHQNLTCIAMGLSVAGLIAALICNLAFLKAVLGFLLGMVFFAASVVCQAIFTNQAFLRVEDAEIDEISLSGYKRTVIALAEKSIGLTVLLTGFTSPLAMVDAYLGLGAYILLIWGSIGAANFMIVYSIVLYFLNHSLLKKGVYSLPEKEYTIYCHNRSLKKKCATGLLSILAATLLLQAVGSELVWSTHNLADGKALVFEDYESFVSYMEQDIPDDYFDLDDYGTVSVPVPDDAFEDTVYYDEYGNEISEEEALTRTIHDQNGKVVCTYVERNRSVASVSYSAQNGTVLPIHVVTNHAYRDAANLSETINTLYCFFYPLELLTFVLIYFKKRAK